jgi:hypothetical protein
MKNDNPLFVSENDPSTAVEADKLPNATTQIDNDGMVEVAKISAYMPLKADYMASTDSGFHQEISDFLAKPYPIQTGVISGSDTPTTFGSYEVLQSHLTNYIYSNKVAGFLGIRATHVFRLQINANRFQQGRYILAWVPFGGGGSKGTNTNGNAEFTRRIFYKTTVTQLPHVEIDINTTTEAILEVPFTSAFPYYPIGGSTAKGFCLGYVLLYPYQPLASAGGSTTASFTIYSSLKDVELIAPTVPQMGLRKGTKKTNATQISSSVSKDPSQEEQSSKGIGPIQATAQKVSAVASYVGSQIPLLSSIAGPVSWYSDIVGGVASVFGFSNPIDLNEVTRAVQTVQPYANNCDMPDASMPVALFGRNQIEMLPGFGSTDLDEMSIDYIKTIPAYWYTFNFSTSNAVGDKLTEIGMAPNIMFATLVDHGITTYVNTPLSFLSKLFNYWRGSIRITLKIVKTEFHSGRIEVVYIPQEPFGINGTATNVSTAAQRAFVHREIIDIRAGNQIDILVPYVSMVPWRNLGDKIGSFQVYVVNPLVAPATVPSTINFLIEVAAGPDFEVAWPRAHGMLPIMPTAPQMSFRTKKNDDAIVTEELGNSSSMDITHLEARVCIGEKVMSLNSLIRSSDKVETFTLSGGNNTYFFDPFSLPTVFNNAGAVLYPTTDDIVDNLGFISQCYLFNRGGVRIRTQNQNTSTNSAAPIRTIAFTQSNTYTGANQGVTAINQYTHELSVTQNQVFRGGIEIQVPQYLQTHSRVSASQLYSITGVGVFTPNPMCSRLALAIVYPGTTDLTLISRQAADDYTCGFWLGVPPTIGE